MTDKEIIIDGVDVSGCRDYDAGECLSPCTTVRSCEAEKNCTYKQLKRLEAENVELKNRLIILDEEDVTVQITTEEFEEFKNLKTENAKLKVGLELFQNAHDTEQSRRRKFENCLGEIKEIASNQDLYSGRQALATKILQKISECEV